VKIKVFRKAVAISVVLIAVFSIQPVSADLIKKTKSGSCHPSVSSYYERTKSYKAFESVPVCLAAGGRLPKGMDGNALSNTSALAETGYSKVRFGNGWANIDGDC
jgi:hypothetical protein